MKTYKVYFSQINQQCFEVMANGRTSAINKACKEYRAFLKYGQEPCAVEEQEKP